MKEFNVYKIREDFPILSTSVNNKPLVYLDNAATTQKPQVVIDALVEFYKTLNSNVHRANHHLSNEATLAFEKGRMKVKAFLNAEKAEEIILTRGTTESINLLANTLGKLLLKEGDEVVISAMEHHSNIVPWQMICEEKKAKVRVLPMNDNGELILEEFDNIVTDKTKIISVNHISNTLGTINPIEEIIEKAHQRNIPVVIDGAQAAPHTNIDVQDLDCDFYCFSGHKVFGPTGIGALYGKMEWLEKMPPYMGGGEMIDTVTFEKTTYGKPPFKFEAGTPNIADAAALKYALQYVENIGFENIQLHENNLLTYATERLADIDELKFIGEAKNKASVISFVLKDIHPGDLGMILDKMGIAVRIGNHCTEPIMKRFGIPGTVRASFAFYNTMEEIDIFVKSLKRAILMLR